MKLFPVIAVMALALIGSAFAGPTSKPAQKPVSRYMRDMGILYLETVEQLTLDCGHKSTKHFG